MNKYKRASFLLLLAAASYQSANAQDTKSDTLLQSFQNPGNAARPRVWWHWMNGNITKDGIRKGLNMDVPLRYWWLPEFRCRLNHATNSREAPNLYDT